MLPCLISSISICHAPDSEIQVKSYGPLNLPGGSMFNFEHLDILYTLIGHPRIKLWHLNFSRGSVVIFQASRYIMPLNQTSESKVVAVWICLAHWCLISSMSIYYAPESNIWVKSYDHMSFPRASVVQFWESRYIVGLDRTSESNVMAICICLVLPCLISSISIYYAPEPDILVKSYGRLNLPCASMFNFERLYMWCAWSDLRV